MDGHREKSVDQLSVGMLASLMQLQGCRGYTPIDSGRAVADLKELRAATPAAEARQQVREDLQSFWSRLRRLRRGRRSSRRHDSGSRSRSEARRDKKRPGAWSPTQAGRT
ncbi:rpl31 [Symbiodinium pilosum]|uniref:Rpl31 protein n=1 Tax=Symbiodinium pilosum TaxID=2952 RepID=A0A812TTY5_SYMPI|nr:rpl31 [Symbiodinium pilosum]